MRPMYVPVRLAAAVAVVAAAAGCMSVGDDAGGGAKPSHSAGQHGGAAPDGGSGVPGGGIGFGGSAGDGKHGHGKPGPGSPPRVRPRPARPAVRRVRRPPRRPDRARVRSRGHRPRPCRSRPRRGLPRPRTRRRPRSPRPSSRPSRSPRPRLTRTPYRSWWTVNRRPRPGRRRSDGCDARQCGPVCVEGWWVRKVVDRLIPLPGATVERAVWRVLSLAVTDRIEAVDRANHGVDGRVPTDTPEGFAFACPFPVLITSSCPRTRTRVTRRP